VGSGVIDEHSAHYVRRNTHEMAAALPVHLFSGKPEICLMDQCSWLQSVVGPLPPHVRLGQAMQFLIDKREQFLLRCAVASADRLQQNCHSSLVVGHE
jgi:hypothetical protein